MKPYRIFALINTIGFFIIVVIIYGILEMYAHNINVTYKEMGLELPINTVITLAILKFCEHSLALPWITIILWFFGNILFMESLFRRKPDKVEFLLLHLEVIIVQLMFYLTAVLLAFWSFYYPFYIDVKVMSEDAKLIYTIDKILVLVMFFLIIVGFILSRLLYKRRKTMLSN